VFDGSGDLVEGLMKFVFSVVQLWKKIALAVTSHFPEK
jgi:hypothetical protein